MIMIPKTFSKLWSISNQLSCFKMVWIWYYKLMTQILIMATYLLLIQTDFLKWTEPKEKNGKLPFFQSINILL